MTDVAITEAPGQLESIVAMALRSPEPVFLTREGIRVAAVVDAVELERLYEAVEDLEDIRAAAAARKESERTGQAPIPWKDIKRGLGLM
ncbi:type II toxin-antitoxin system Phd/YefM family antitoxin [Arthrobacter sp. NA-172]|uniref:type II toxin-antitoxin system Phd/YefM family antitoxin n=1 Tax=Arthrobacter sp. NA-172 TaxID=3367524 RepID=UPI003754A3C1